MFTFDLRSKPEATGIVLGALLLGAVCVHARAASSNDQPVTIRINAARRVGQPIPETIFGSFLEPIGNSTYNGLWAEILQNPSFESGLWDARHIDQMIKDDPQLARASTLGLPEPWEPLDLSEANRYEPRRGNAANSWESLAVLGVPGHETGIKQQVFLPVYRTRQYRGSLYVKHLSGPDQIEVSLRKRDHPDQILVHSTLNAGQTEWTRYEFNFDLAPGQLAALEPADFVITVQGDERAEFDQASLMPADAVDGLDPDMVAMAKPMHTPLVRFGGNFTSAYHWRDGVGPRDKRVNARNIAWGIPEYNQFGTDEFLRFCELIGAQPQIALNLGSGTPEEAADWVRYVNQHSPQHGGLWWELGNELWGNWNLGYPTLEELPGRTLAFSETIRQVDPKAKLIATGQDPDHFESWNAAQLSNPRDTFQLLSTHFVVTTDRVEDQKKTPDQITAAAFALPVELGRKLQAMQAQIDASPNVGKSTHIAFTEWLFVCCNGGALDAPRFDNMGGAIAAAGFFNMLLRNAGIVPVSDMTGIIEFAGIWKKRGRVFAAPSYYTFRMFSTAQPETAVEVENNAGTYDVHGGVTRLPEISGIPYLDVTAVRSKSGDRLTLFCINRDLNRDIPANIAVSDFDSREQADVQELYAHSIYEVNDELHPEHIVPERSVARLNGSHLTYTFRHESVTRIDLNAR